tara:strand:- start:170 stop:367 length:198 start_codon:yes stop_codon:yes gene_type:complete
LVLVLQEVQMVVQVVEEVEHLYGVCILLNPSHLLWLQLLAQEAMLGVPQGMEILAKAALCLAVVK